ncbi:hypothetical protein H257_13762 [Aphanomyces astaci]|uniref:GCVT N-terminal domain-containing protein n=1 Tax=Aphanomyces astaci TaxID=112090 RepID=W4FT64_APHAT|nr:hypothetical protein H257_13762 [Aphanomyces astaci]ETV70647.1 hypothetical protein H257_13762 [Aphanomyces astaci]|eukprot:XP_009839712.1 hypothetical protein H257_13762 [Aphanomyces astaci]
MTHLLHRGGLVTALSRTRVLRVEGPDALKFLQGIFTNDVHGLKTRGDVRYGAFLSHKGRTLTDAEVVLHETDALFLKVDAAAEEDMLKHLKKYKLRSKVTISAAHDYVRAHAILPSLADPTATPFLPSWTADQNETHRDGVVYVDPRSAAFGSTAILPVEHASCTSLVMHCVGSHLSGFRVVDIPSEYVVAEDEDVGDLAAQDRRIVLGACSGLEWRDGIPLEYNLDLLHGVSMTKGCYVGQELISRTHYKGNIRKRTLPCLVVPVAAEVDMPPPPFPFGSSGSLDASAGLAWATQHLTAVAPPVEVDTKLMAHDAAAGKIVAVATGVNAVVAMVRLEHLNCGNIVTDDGRFRLLPYSPAWWPALNLNTGKLLSS